MLLYTDKPKEGDKPKLVINLEQSQVTATAPSLAQHGFQVVVRVSDFPPTTEEHVFDCENRANLNAWLGATKEHTTFASVQASPVVAEAESSETTGWAHHAGREDASRSRSASPQAPLLAAQSVVQSLEKSLQNARSELSKEASLGANRNSPPWPEVLEVDSPAVRMGHIVANLTTKNAGLEQESARLRELFRVEMREREEAEERSRQQAKTVQQLLVALDAAYVEAEEMEEEPAGPSEMEKELKERVAALTQALTSRRASHDNLLQEHHTAKQSHTADQGVFHAKHAELAAQHTQLLARHHELTAQHELSNSQHHELTKKQEEVEQLLHATRHSHALSLHHSTTTHTAALDESRQGQSKREVPLTPTPPHCNAH